MWIFVLKLDLFVLFSLVIKYTDGKYTCTEEASNFWTLSYPFLKDQHLITIVAIEDGSKPISENLMKCAQAHLSVPIVYYMNPLDINIINEGYDEYVLEYKPNSFHGYVMVCATLACSMLRMEQNAALNPDAKTIFVQTSGETHEIEYLLHMSWIRYYMLNVIAFYIAKKKPNYDNEYEASDKWHRLGTDNTQTYFMYVYNPFELDALTAQRGRMIVHRIENTTGDILERNWELGQSIVNIIAQRLKNLHRYPVKIAMIPSSALTRAVRDKEGKIVKFTNLDGELVNILAEQVNFEPIYLHPPSDGSNFGDYHPKTGYSGVLGFIEKGLADMGGNLRPILDQHNRNTAYLNSVKGVTFWFLTPQMDQVGGPVPSMSFLNIFDATTAILLMITYLSLVACWHLMQCFYTKFLMRSSVTKNVGIKERHLSYIDLVFMVFGALIMAPQALQLARRYEKFTFAFIMCFATILSTYYQGTMVKLLTSGRTTANIESLEELADSGLRIQVTGLYRDLLNTSEGADSVFARLFRRQVIINNIEDAVANVAVKRDSALLLPEMVCVMAWASIKDRVTGGKLLHLLRQGPPTRSGAFLIRNMSPYRVRFNNLLMAAREAGLVQQWTDQTLLKYRRKAHQDVTIDDTNATTFTMRQLKAVFILWAAGMTLSLVVLTGELVFYKSQRRRTKK